MAKQNNFKIVEFCKFKDIINEQPAVAQCSQQSINKVMEWLSASMCRWHMKDKSFEAMTSTRFSLPHSEITKIKIQVICKCCVEDIRHEVWELTDWSGTTAWKKKLLTHRGHQCVGNEALHAMKLGFLLWWWDGTGELMRVWSPHWTISKIIYEHLLFFINRSLSSPCNRLTFQNMLDLI